MYHIILQINFYTQLVEIEITICTAHQLIGKINSVLFL